MEKIALITDSACDIDDETLQKYHVRVLPFKIRYHDREYTDKVDITPEEIYLHMDKEIPSSSLPALDSIESLFHDLVQEGYTHVISINISSGISGTANGIQTVSRNFPQISTFIFDTKSTSICEGILVKKCGEYLASGMDFQTLTQKLPDMKKKIHFLFVFGTLEYAIKGGRIGKIPGTIGNVLDIKPIVGFDGEHGQCYTAGKIRGKNKIIRRLSELADQYTAEQKCDAYVIHGNVAEKAESLCALLRQHPGINQVFLVGQISAIVGVYCGPGTIGVAYSEII